MEKLSTIR